MDRHMQQTSLFDTEPPGSAAAMGLVVAGGKSTLSKSQKQFNQLIERLQAQRAALAEWQTFRVSYQQQVEERYQPLATRLRVQRIALARRLDQAMRAKGLTARERDKVRDILGQLLAELLLEAEDPELIALHDRYAEASFAEQQQECVDLMREVASDSFGIDVNGYTGGDTPAELADWLDAQVHAAQPEPPRSRRPNNTAKARKREALREQAAEGGTRAVREVYRKLVSELHPDRETDPAEQLRKTALMQRVNQAYEARNLLELLELQLAIEQIDANVLAGLAEERLRHYIHVLEEQSRQLREELDDLVAPFAMALEGYGSRKLRPDLVQRAFDADIGELKRLLRSVEAELGSFQDLRQLKQALKQYRVEQPDDDEWVMPGYMPTSPRRRSRARRR
jgi:hypothetical protein